MPVYDLNELPKRWTYHHPLMGFSGNVAAGPTRSEARAVIKRELKMDRVPVGTQISPVRTDVLDKLKLR